MDVQKNPISLLQELLMKRRTMPVYTISQSGLSFKCHVRALEEVCEGVGRSKQEAKSEAAMNLLEKLFGITHHNSGKSTEIPHFVNHIGELYNLCAISRLGSAIFIEHHQSSVSKFAFICQLNDKKFIGYGSTKQMAKHEAARGMIALLKKNNIIPDTEIGTVPLVHVSRVDDDKLTELIKSKLDELHIVSKEKRAIYKSNFQGINSFHTFFSNDKSPTALDLCSLSPEAIDKLPDPERTFKRIIAEYGYKQESCVVNRQTCQGVKYIFFIKIFCSCIKKCSCPLWTFSGVGDTTQAKKDAVISGLKFFSNMVL